MDTSNTFTFRLGQSERKMLVFLSQKLRRSQGGTLRELILAAAQDHGYESLCNSSIKAFDQGGDYEE